MTCVTCHSSADPKVKQAIAAKNRDYLACHVQADHETVHTDELDSKCQTCHKATLTAEHLNNELTTAGRNYDCNTCHASTTKEVIRTISAGNPNCADYHGTRTHNILFAAKVPADIVLNRGLYGLHP